MPVQLLGTLTADDGAPACVQVADISRGGACCRVAQAPAPGTAVILKLDGLRARGIVCWSSGTLLGLRFVEPLRASDILIQSGRSRGSARPARAAHHAGIATRERHGG